MLPTEVLGHTHGDLRLKHRVAVVLLRSHGCTSRQDAADLENVELLRSGFLQIRPTSQSDTRRQQRSGVYAVAYMSKLVFISSGTDLVKALTPTWIGCGQVAFSC